MDLCFCVHIYHFEFRQQADFAFVYTYIISSFANEQTLLRSSSFVSPLRPVVLCSLAPRVTRIHEGVREYMGPHSHMGVRDGD